jgi:type I restriction-modification system DNA methylase subunit
MKNFREKADLIWRVDDLLRGDNKQCDYGIIILPMTVLRHLDCVLACTKRKILSYLPKVKSLRHVAKDLALNMVADFNFLNWSQFDFDKFLADTSHMAANLCNFINGFSACAGVNKIDTFKYAFDDFFNTRFFDCMEQNQKIFEKILEEKAFGDLVKELMNEKDI